MYFTDIIFSNVFFLFLLNLKEYTREVAEGLFIATIK